MVYQHVRVLFRGSKDVVYYFEMIEEIEQLYVVLFFFNER